MRWHNVRKEMRIFNTSVLLYTKSPALLARTPWTVASVAKQPIWTFSGLIIPMSYSRRTRCSDGSWNKLILWHPELVKLGCILTHRNCILIEAKGQKISKLLAWFAIYTVHIQSYKEDNKWVHSAHFCHLMPTHLANFHPAPDLHSYQIQEGGLMWKWALAYPS